MSVDSGLRGQLFLALGTVGIVVAAAGVAGTFTFYTLLLDYYPSFPSTVEKWIPAPIEWLWFAGALIAGALLAAGTAIWQANKILKPLRTLTQAIRDLAHGDLSARAHAPIGMAGEFARLIADFNGMAERVQRSTDELRMWNAAISHELRTPITILVGRLYALEDGVFKPDAKQFGSLRSQGEALARLVDDLRLLSMADGKQLLLQKRPVNLAAFIHDVVDLMTPHMSQAGFRIAVDADDEMVNCDEAKVRQVLLALLENASRYVEGGDVHVVATVMDSRLILSVSDSGPGLAEKFLPYAFEAFRRYEGSRSRSTGGSGLGLAIVRAIAEVHGGSVSYRRAPQGGALFEVNFDVRIGGEPGTP
ncbi:MAG: HAMP domain-containing histidine kinase [Rubrivivax sp.]|nr:MAG: HAMP domain-containing histidine kinase [Rubrivivax sp.]